MSVTKRIGIWQWFHRVKSRKGFPWGTTNVKNAAGGLPMWEAQIGQIHLSCPGVRLSQEPWEHFCSMNIFAREIIVGFPNYVCMSCARVACDLELKFWVSVCALGFNIFAVWWCTVREFDERNECFPQKHSAQKHKRVPAVCGLLVKNLCTGDLYYFPSLGEFGEMIHCEHISSKYQRNLSICSLYH